MYSSPSFPADNSPLHTE